MKKILSYKNLLKSSLYCFMIAGGIQLIVLALSLLVQGPAEALPVNHLNTYFFTANDFLPYQFMAFWSVHLAIFTLVALAGPLFANQEAREDQGFWSFIPLVAFLEPFTRFALGLVFYLFKGDTASLIRLFGFSDGLASIYIKVWIPLALAYLILRNSRKLTTNK